MPVFQGHTEDGKPLFGVTDSNLYTISERSKFPWLLELSVQLHDANEHGLPTASELSRVNAYQDSLLRDLAGVTEVQHVAHCTGDGFREIYTYLADPDAAHAFLTRLTQRSTPFEFEYRMTQDPDWNLIRDRFGADAAGPAATDR